MKAVLQHPLFGAGLLACILPAAIVHAANGRAVWALLDGFVIGLSVMTIALAVINRKLERVTRLHTLALVPPPRPPLARINVMSFQHALGSKVRDRITGVTGTVIGRSEWLYGCRRYVVQPTELKDHRPVEPCHFDEDGLELLEAPAVPHEVKATGGPREVEATRW